MGHTHFAIDGLTEPIYLGGNRTGYYYNSGTWTWHLRERPDGYTWQQLSDPANYTLVFHLPAPRPRRAGRLPGDVSELEC